MLFNFATTPKSSLRLFKLFIGFLKQNNPTKLDKLVSFPIMVFPCAGCILLMLQTEATFEYVSFSFWVDIVQYLFRLMYYVIC